MTLTTIDETSKILAFSGDEDDNASDDDKDLGIEEGEGIEGADDEETKEEDDDFGLGDDDEDDEDDEDGDEE